LPAWRDTAVCIERVGEPVRCNWNFGRFKLTTDSLITIVGTIVTIIGMVVTIWQSAQARSYKNQIKFDIRKINLSGAIERLRRAQDNIRKLPTSNSHPKGIKWGDQIHSIKDHFDFALGVIDSKGPDCDVRQLLSNAQSKLNSYEASCNAGNPQAQDVNDLQINVQDAIALSNSRIYQLEGKA